SSVCVVNVFCIPYFIKITLAIVTYAEVSYNTPPPSLLRVFQNNPSFG
ncbi:MAG: hypothetical protein ACI88H_004087, partial [Cocleimonas sp.]